MDLGVHFVFAVYLLVLHNIILCAQIRVRSCLVTDNFGMFTEIAVCKLLRGLAVVRPGTLYIYLSIVSVYTFSASFYTAHCALDLARDHAPYKMSIIIKEGKIVRCLLQFL